MKHNKGEESFSTRVPGTFQLHNSTLDFSILALESTNLSQGYPRRRREARRRQGKPRAGKQMTPTGDSAHQRPIRVLGGDSRHRRQAATVKQGQSCSGCSNSGEGKGNAGQLVPVAALERPREEVRSLGWWGIGRSTEFTAGAPMADGSGSVLARGEDRSAFIDKHALTRGSRASSHGGPWHGQGGGAVANSRPGAARRAYGGVAVGWPARRV
jgi:hypothetical protein